MAVARKTYDAYKDTEIATANQGKLIVMLYDGAIRFLRIAIDNLEPKTYDVANNNIIKAQDIVTELMLSLNMQEGGEMAQNLFNIYAYLKKRLLEGNIYKDEKILKEVLTHLDQMKEAWEQASAKAPAQAASKPVDRPAAGFSIQG